MTKSQARAVIGWCFCIKHCHSIEECWVSSAFLGYMASMFHCFRRANDLGKSIRLFYVLLSYVEQPYVRECKIGLRSCRNRWLVGATVNLSADLNTKIFLKRFEYTYVDVYM